MKTHLKLQFSIHLPTLEFKNLLSNRILDNPINVWTLMNLLSTQIKKGLKCNKTQTCCNFKAMLVILSKREIHCMETHTLVGSHLKFNSSQTIRWEGINLGRIYKWVTHPDKSWSLMMVSNLLIRYLLWPHSSKVKLRGALVPTLLILQRTQVYWLGLRVF